MAQEITALLDDKEIKSFLKGLSKRSNEPQKNKEYVDLLSAITFKEINDHFIKEEGPSDNWKPWSKIYTDHMSKIGKSGNKILQDTGRLRQSFFPTNYRTSSEGVLWFNNAQTKGGFPYAAAHDQGGPKLPQREFMWLSDKAVEKMTEQTLAYILDEK